MPELELFHVPPSFYSQVARLALAEKGLRWRTHITPPGPPTFDSYQPAYVRLNPEMTVPALRHGERVVIGSLNIARYADAGFDGPALTPEDPAEMERWLARFEALSVRELSYGTMTGPLPAFMNRQRLGALRRARAKAPELDAAYAAKIADIEAFAAAAADPQQIATQRARLDEALDALEAALRQRPFVAGERYSLADVAWTVMAARLLMLKLPPFHDRPALGAWYQRMRARPAFEAADVWERFNPARLLPVLTRRYPWVPAGLGLALLAGVIWLAWG